jgi:endonuclease/exonuclease/phosphatase family metal-dependent hydrolase
MEGMRRSRLLGLLSLLLLCTTVGLQAQSIRVVTINVWSGLDYKGYLKMGHYQAPEVLARRTELLVDQLTALDADVIAINEANKLPRYARMLAGRLGYDFIYHVGIGGLRAGPVGLPLNLREGDVILSRKSLKLRSAGRKQLSGGPVGNFFTAHFADATQVIAGRIAIGDNTLYLFNTHWHASPFPTEQYFEQLAERRDSGEIDEQRHAELAAEAVEGQKWRLEEAHNTVAFIETVAGDQPVVLMGDFNAESSSEEIGVLKAAGFIDVYARLNALPGYTWDGALNSNIKQQKSIHPDDFWEEPTRKRIDYIFIRGRDLQALGSEVVLDLSVEGLFPSDHFGVMADLALEAD